MEKIINIDPKHCRRWAYADRSDFEMGDLFKLAQDIRENGQIEPVVVRPTGDKDTLYEVITGSRRFEAARSGDLSLRARVVNLSDGQAFVAQVKENQKEGISDYSKGIFYSRLLEGKKATKAEILSVAQISRTQLDRFLTFKKVPEVIWRSVGNISKVSVRAAQTIFLLSKKGEAFVEALLEISDEIKKGAGSRRIDEMVGEIIQGESGKIDHEASLVLPSGQKIGTWKKNGIQFSKDIPIDQKKLSKALLVFFGKEQTTRAP